MDKTHFPNGLNYFAVLFQIKLGNEYSKLAGLNKGVFHEYRYQSEI